MSSTLSTDVAGTYGDDKVTNKHRPSDIEGNPIIWDDNPATIEGILFEAKRYYVRKGYFRMLLESGAVQLPNGKTAIESVQSAQFVSGSFRMGNSTDSTIHARIRQVVSRSTILNKYWRRKMSTSRRLLFQPHWPIHKLYPFRPCEMKTTNSSLLSCASWAVQTLLMSYQTFLKVQG